MTYSFQGNNNIVVLDKKDAENWTGEFYAYFDVSNEEYMGLFNSFIRWLFKVIKSNMNNQDMHNRWYRESP